MSDDQGIDRYLESTRGQTASSPVLGEQVFWCCPCGNWNRAPRWACYECGKHARDCRLQGLVFSESQGGG